MADNDIENSLNEENIINDQIDLSSLFSILLDNFNFLISALLGGLVLSSIIYITAENIYSSKSLIEIQQQQNMFGANIPGMNRGNENSLLAEVAIYKSANTIEDVVNYLKTNADIEEEDIPSAGYIRSNLTVSSNGRSLITIIFNYSDPYLTQEILRLLNQEYIDDRRDFRKRSTAAGREFIKSEIPKIKLSLTKAEDNLNNFKLSKNDSGLIFESENTSLELNNLYQSIKEIEFKEVELREFYKTTHPIYQTLTEQKKFLQNKIDIIESDLPSIPDTQRKLENLKREVEIYSDVLSDLSSQEINLAMAEASSNSNVRIINQASVPSKIQPTIYVFFIPFAIILFIYLIQAIRHFLGDRITNYDALIDFVDKRNVLGELPLYKKGDIGLKDSSTAIAEELMNKISYEVIQSQNRYSSISIVGSKKGVGKTEISEKLFYKLTSMGKKVCLLDLDYKKRDLTLKSISPINTPKNFQEFYEDIETYRFEQSLFIPSFDVDNSVEFFMSDDFKEQINKLKQEYDLVICDTPPWGLFVDAKIISKYFDSALYVVGNKISTFKDIILFNKDIESINKNIAIKYFYNKFDIFFNFLWYKYQYPNYSDNYYYEYSEYRNPKKFLFQRIFDKLRLFFTYLKEKWLK
ncbi:MAG: AAA family ATPase [Flavobacteriales bacterium]